MRPWFTKARTRLLLAAALAALPLLWLTTTHASDPPAAPPPPAAPQAPDAPAPGAEDESAPDEMAVEEDPIPLELNDPAFERFVDLHALRQAILDGDAEVLADSALQLAYGEKVLQRPHKGLKADRVFALAVRVAGEKRDKATLARLAQAAGEGQKPLVEAAQKLAASPARSLVSPKVPLTELTPESLATVQEYTDAIEAAARLGDREKLQELQKALKDVELSQALKDHLNRLAAEALKNAPEQADADNEALQKLAGSSRGWPNISLPRIPTPRLPRLPTPDQITGNSRYNVVIRNKTRWRIPFTIGGTRTYVNPGRGVRATGRTRGKVQIYFLITSGNYRRYSLDSGRTYYFAGPNQRNFNLYRQ